MGHERETSARPGLPRDIRNLWILAAQRPTRFGFDVGTDTAPATVRTGSEESLAPLGRRQSARPPVARGRKTILGVAAGYLYRTTGAERRNGLREAGQDEWLRYSRLFHPAETRPHGHPAAHLQGRMRRGAAQASGDG